VSNIIFDFVHSNLLSLGRAGSLAFGARAFDSIFFSGSGSRHSSSFSLYLYNVFYFIVFITSNCRIIIFDREREKPKPKHEIHEPTSTARASQKFIASEQEKIVKVTCYLIRLCTQNTEFREQKTENGFTRPKPQTIHHTKC
jgi:hypothetical protein